MQTTLERSDRDDGFGFSLSNGIYDSGVYVGAVKDRGPAADKLQPYDRILKVHLVYCGFSSADRQRKVLRKYHNTFIFSIARTIADYFLHRVLPKVFLYFLSVVLTTLTPGAVE